MDLDTKWVVAEVKHRASQYGNIIEEVTFANADWQIAYTYLDPGNQNYKNWKDIVDLFDRGCGVIVQGLRAKKIKHKSGYSLINADSPVKIRHVELDRQIVVDALAEELVENTAR